MDNTYSTKESVSLKDYKLNEAEISKLPGFKRGEAIEYHQPDYGNGVCGMLSNITVISNYLGKRVDDEDIKNIVKSGAKDYGYAPKTGMRMYRGVDCVRDYWNKNKEDKFYTVRVKSGSKEFKALLEKGYIGVTGYYANNAEFLKDKNDDGDINTIDNLSYRSYGHLVCICDNKGVYFIDTFKKTAPYNKYHATNYDKLRNNGVFFKSVFFWVPLDHIDKPKMKLTKKEQNRLNKLRLLNSAFIRKIDDGKFDDKLLDVNEYIDGLLENNV